MSSGSQDFQAFTVKFNGTASRVLTHVHVFPAFDPANPPDPLPPGHQTQALWDTGATGSVISPAVASALGLTPVGSVQVAHAGGGGVSNTYLVNFRLPHGVGVSGVLVTEFPAGGDFDAIIGMDIMCLGDLSLTNVDGRTCMSFRMPSLREVDFVAEHKRAKQVRAPAKVGRNDPCPCGRTTDSGKPVKYKHCHGKLA